MNHLDNALRLLQARDVAIGAAKGFELVDALLAAGRGDEARDLFERLEPLDALLGSEPYDLWTRDRSLDARAERALVFRRPAEVLAALERLGQWSTSGSAGVESMTCRPMRSCSRRGGS